MNEVIQKFLKEGKGIKLECGLRGERGVRERWRERAKRQEGWGIF